MTSYPGSVPAPAPRRSNRTLFIIIGVVAVVLCVCVMGSLTLFGGIFGAVLGATAAPADTADKYMTAIKNSDWQGAYDLCDSTVQQQIGGVSGMQDFIVKNRVQPTAWNFTSRNINNGTAEISGDATFTGNRKGTVDLVLGQSGSSWKITGINLKES